MSIYYKAGYKYQLELQYTLAIPIKPESLIASDYLSLSSQGTLVIDKGYSWDGPSDPAVDTPNFMRGSLVHDALYQLMREGKLKSTHKETADKLLRAICKEDGMSSIRAWWVYQGVKKFGASATKSKNRKPILTAP